jgi:N-acetyl-anhydromuramoyl-L-alanine amidase
MPAIVAYAYCRIGTHEEFVLQVDLESGLMRGARHVASPNFDARPEGAPIDLIVIHGISLPPGEFGGPWIDRLFTNSLPLEMHPYFAEIAGLRVSSHLVIARDGVLTQYVSFNDRAWHAGRSSYQGRVECNDYSVGVELEGADIVPYEAAQYEVLAEAIAALCVAYPLISTQRITGHSDVAPGRKTDPVTAFDWPLARRCIAAKVRQTAPQP